MDILAFILGLVVGTLLMLLLMLLINSKSNKRNLQASLWLEEKKYLQTQLKNAELALQQKARAEDNKNEELIRLHRQLTAAQSSLKHAEERLSEHKSELAELQLQFKIQFKQLAQDIFEEKSQKFAAINQQNIGDLLNPLKERIKDFEQKVDHSSKQSIAWHSALKEQLNHLKEANLQITKEAINLTNALKGDKKMQGGWGEMQLEAILNKTGLEKETHYLKEQNFKDENGNNQRPDYIIKLPDQKFLVLDSKVSLNAYTDYFDAKSEEEQQLYLKKHLSNLYQHVKDLSSRNYQNLYDISQPDYVLLFVANEAALTIALREDHNLYEKALDKNIILVSTTTLLATLRTISYIWKQDMQSKNAMEIARQAASLYDKFTSFTDDMLKIGHQLDQTQHFYEAAMKKLSTGKDNLIRKTERLQELGVKPGKQISHKLRD